MKAIILAAGMGTRLQPLTDNTPKCLICVNGTPILENAFTHLAKNDINQAVLVVGHLAEKVRGHFGDRFGHIDITYIDNTIYDKTNNLYSLWLAREHLQDDTLLMENDLFFEGKVVDSICRSDIPNLAVVDNYQSHMDGTVVTAANGLINDFIMKKNQYDSMDFSDKLKTVNIYKFSKEFLERHFVPTLQDCVTEGLVNEFYELAISRVVNSKLTQIAAFSINGLKWFEIDSIEDLEIAESIFSPQLRRVRKEPPHTWQNTTCQMLPKREEKGTAGG